MGRDGGRLRAHHQSQQRGWWSDGAAGGVRSGAASWNCEIDAPLRGEVEAARLLEAAWHLPAR